MPDSVARWYSPTIVADGLTLAMNLQSPGLSDIVRVRRNSERPLLLRKNTVVGKVILLDNSMAQPAIVSATSEQSLPPEGEGGQQRQASLNAFVETESKRHFQVVADARGGIVSVPGEIHLSPEPNPTFSVVHA